MAFPEYDGPQDYESTVQFISTKFKEQKKSLPQVYSHLTCATDTSNMKFVLQSVTDMLIKNFLKDCGIY